MFTARFIHSTDFQLFRRSVTTTAMSTRAVVKSSLLPFRARFQNLVKINQSNTRFVGSKPCWNAAVHTSNLDQSTSLASNGQVFDNSALESILPGVNDISTRKISYLTGPVLTESLLQQLPATMRSFALPGKVAVVTG